MTAHDLVSFDAFWERQLSARLTVCSPANIEMYTKRCIGPNDTYAPSAHTVETWVAAAAHRFASIHPTRLTMHISVGAHRNWIAGRRLPRGPQGWPAYNGIEVRADIRQGSGLVDRAHVRHNRVVVLSDYLVPAGIDPAWAKLHTTLRDDGVRAATACDATMLLAAN